MFIVHVSSSEMCVPRNLKLDTLHHLLVDIQWCMYILFPPEIVFCFFDVQGQIVLRAPPHQPLYLLSLGRLSPLVINPNTVISSTNLIRVLVLYDGIQSCVYREKRNGLNTHPCGTPVLIVKVEELCGPILTDCGRSVKKSLIHRQMLYWMPRSDILENNLLGKIVLIAELKSKNNSRAYVPWCSKWHCTVWRVMEIASSVDLLVLYAYWWGSKVGGRVVLMWCRTSLSRHFMITGVNTIGL